MSWSSTWAPPSSIQCPGTPTAALPSAHSKITPKLYFQPSIRPYPRSWTTWLTAGLLDSTLVLATGEFGRSPRINAYGGRDHWPGVWSGLLAGGPVAGGRVLGASDRQASQPADQPVALPDLLATLYHFLGIDPGKVVTTDQGLSFPLVDQGQPIKALLA